MAIDNRDGPVENYSWNCGWEGDEGTPADVMALRRQQMKNFCCLLLLSNGTPMLRAGDEFMHTPRGNSNPYNQDNDTTWLDWRRLQTNREMFRFFKLAIAFRKAHPSLARSRFWSDDVRWHGVGADPDLAYDSHSLAFCLRGAAEGDDDLYVMINAYWRALTFTVHDGGARTWKRVVDTSLTSPSDFREPGFEVPLQSRTYSVAPRSVVVLIRSNMAAEEAGSVAGPFDQIRTPAAAPAGSRAETGATSGCPPHAERTGERREHGTLLAPGERQGQRVRNQQRGAGRIAHDRAQSGGCDRHDETDGGPRRREARRETAGSCRSPGASRNVAALIGGTVSASLAKPRELRQNRESS